MPFEALPTQRLFIAMAQISLTMAALTTITLSLQQRTGKPWRRSDVTGLKFILLHTAAAAILSLTPLLTHQLLGAGDWVWRWPFIAAAVLLLALCVVNVRWMRRVAPGDPAVHQKALLAGYIVPTFVLSLTCCAFATWNADGLPGWFLLVVLYFLAQAACQWWISFERFTSPHTDSEDA